MAVLSLLEAWVNGGGCEQGADGLACADGVHRCCSWRSSEVLVKS
jgi:hypothetical protein